jgi:hypothetical protein
VQGGGGTAADAGVAGGGAFEQPTVEATAPAANTANPKRINPIPARRELASKWSVGATAKRQAAGHVGRLGAELPENGHTFVVF